MESCPGGGHGPRLGDMPEEFLSQVLARIDDGPRTVSQIASISRLFLAASRADVVWSRFLPHGWADICERAGLQVPGSKRDLFFRLCHEFMLEEGSHESMWLDRSTGAINRRLLASGLNISDGWWGASWKWVTLLGSKSAEVACVESKLSLNIRGRIGPGTFTPGVYTLSWRLGLAAFTGGLYEHPMHFYMKTSDCQHQVVDMFLNRPEDQLKQPCFRSSSIHRCDYGWLEYDVAEFTVSSEKEKFEVSFALLGYSNYGIQGLFVDGVVMHHRHPLVSSPRRLLLPEGFGDSSHAMRFRDDLPDGI